MSHQQKRGADADEEFVEEPTKLDVGADNECSATFAFENEDHTLGNSLRYMLMKSPHVAFCGYSVPHPSEPKMNLRLQTNGEDAGITLSIRCVHATCSIGVASCAVLAPNLKHPHLLLLALSCHSP
jgi:DNA-directed RNA polymerase subunit L